MLQLLMISAAVLSGGSPPRNAAIEAASQTGEASIFDKAVNAPGIGWKPYGQNQTAKQVAAVEVPGGNAVQFRVAKAGEHVWDSGATYPSIKPIAAGDTLLVMVFLRAPNASEGSTVSIPVSIGGSEAPYTPVATDQMRVTSAWKRFYLSGKTAQAYAQGQATITVQLAGAKQVIEVGPAFLIDLGPLFDETKLPRN
jgi:hypothetical protein